MCHVFRGEIQMDHYYNPIEYKKDKMKFSLRKIKEEGLYIFGGKTSKGHATNHLKNIKLGSRPLIMSTLHPSGTPPKARYGHTMNYFSHLNSLVIYGGMNDSFKGRFYDDIFLLDLEMLSWVKVDILGPSVPGKAMHSSQLIDTKIYVFGGID